jgi:hypothetical protein
MLRMDPVQHPRLLQIEENTRTLLTEARQHGWDGEVQGLEETLHHIGEKKAQGERMVALQPASSTVAQSFSLETSVVEMGVP